MAFTFDPLEYVNAGHEQDGGDLDAESREAVVELRSQYPELAVWGDLAIYTAWMCFSDSVRMISWSSELSRTDDFLNFLCWEQTKGEFPFGGSPEQLAEADDWKNAR